MTLDDPRLLEPCYKICADDIMPERARQLQKWGPQHHADGTGSRRYAFEASRFKHFCDVAARYGDVTWRDILLEEVYEALAESERGKLRTELVQVATVCCAWVQDLDERDGDREPGGAAAVPLAPAVAA